MSTTLKNCQFCHSEIAIEAKKCRYCMEWQEEDELSNSKSNNKDQGFKGLDYKSIIKPLHLKLINKLPFNEFVRIFIIVIFLFLYFQIIWIYLDEDQVYLISMGLFSIQMLVVWYGLIWLYNLIGGHQESFVVVSSDESVSLASYPKQFKRIFNNRFALIIGIIFGLIASIGDYSVGTPFKSDIAKWSFAIFEFLNMALAGAGIYSIIMFAIFIKNLDLKKDYKGVSLAANEHIFKIGKLHLKTSIIAIVPFAFGLIAKLLGDWDWNFLIYIWYGGFAIIILIYLFWPLSHIHNLMLADKEKHLNQLNRKIQELMFDINEVPSNRNFSRLFQLQELEKSISKQSTWPFDLKSISAAFIAIILPISLMILDKVILK